MGDILKVLTGLIFVCAVGNGLLADESHRSPLSLALSSDRTLALTANHTSDTVSLVEFPATKVAGELSVGRGPVDVVWLNDATAVVSLLHDDSVAVIAREGSGLKLVRTIAVGDEPRGLAVSVKNHRLYVALAGEDAVAILDTERLLARDGQSDAIEIRRIPVGGIPRTLAISPDEQWLVTCCAVPCELFVHDAKTLDQISARKIFDGGFNPGIPAVTGDSKLVILPSAINRAFSVTRGMIDIGWVIDNRLSKLPLPDGEPGDQKQLGLDIRGKAVGDANSVAFSPDGSVIAVSCGGTHEILILDFATIPWPSGDPGDFLPEPLRNNPARFRRIKTGGRPVDLEFLDANRIAVANYLGDSVQVVDLTTNNVEATVSLGGPQSADLVRRGEIVFYDADRSLHSWFSCHTCHPDGHTSGQVFDTRNDRSYGTPKLIPSLRGVAETGPWTWHGWQTDLKDAMKRSLQESMNTEMPIAEDDVASLAAYMATLAHPRNPRADAESPLKAQGRQLFEGKGGCAKCHSGETFTTAETFDGAVEDSKDRDRLYNPPSLRGVSTRRRFLHTGKAKSLEQVISQYHRPEELVGASMNEDEIRSLVEYLKSL